jgi:hypothetical protein
MMKSRMLFAAVVYLVVCFCSQDLVGKDSPSDPKGIEGLWSGSWGGGGHDGVVFQPVIAELLIKGDHVELVGFPQVGSLRGTVRFDASVKRMQITPTVEADSQAKPKVIDFTYEFKSDDLTITDNDKHSIFLKKRHTVDNPLANAKVELIEATGISETGDLSVTEYTVLQAGRVGTTYFQPQNRSLKTKQATVFVVQDTGLKKITIGDARGLIRKPMPVMVAYRQDNRPSPNQPHELWKEMGPPVPDNEAVGQTFSQILRPGTLIFVLSASENVPQP